MTLNTIDTRVASPKTNKNKKKEIYISKTRIDTCE